MDNIFIYIICICVPAMMIRQVASQQTSSLPTSEATEQLVEIRKQMIHSEERILKSCQETSENS